jgi:predicted transcriptional regulator
MKTPCEVVVWYVLPTIRRELAKELVQQYDIKQSKVAKMFGVTDAAISQYLKNKRGGSSIIETSEHYDLFEDEIKESAKRLAEGTTDISAEMCRICTSIKAIGLLAQIYTNSTGGPAPKCAWGDHALNIDE